MRIIATSRRELLAFVASSLFVLASAQHKGGGQRVNSISADLVVLYVLCGFYFAVLMFGLISCLKSLLKRRQRAGSSPEERESFLPPLPYTEPFREASPVFYPTSVSPLFVNEQIIIFKRDQFTDQTQNRLAPLPQVFVTKRR